MVGICNRLAVDTHIPISRPDTLLKEPDVNRSFLRNLTFFIFAFLGSLSTNLYAGWFDPSDSDNAIQVVENNKPNPNTPLVKYAATIHIAGYSDARTGMPPKKIGDSTQRISGIWGKELVLDRAVTEVVADSVRKRFDDAGFPLIKESGGALYELSGVVKELTYNAKARHETAIAVESTLKEVATGKVVWSGVVVEKNERDASSASSKNDVANRLRYTLGIVTQKTVEAISGSLMASRPDLFSLAPGTKPISGVTVLQATGTSTVKATAAANGILALTTKPARAKVYLDGVYFGMSPLRVEIESGIHDVSVKAEGYKAASEKLSIRKGDTTELELVLER